MDAYLWLAVFVMLLLVVNLAVLAIAQRRAEGTTVQALTAAGCRCETWREGLHWPGCPILGGLQADPHVIDKVVRGGR